MENDTEHENLDMANTENTRGGNSEINPNRNKTCTIYSIYFSNL